MSLNKYYILPFFLLFCTLFGCMDDLIAPDNQLNGTVYNVHGQPLVSYRTKISCGDYPIIFTYNTSSFKTSTISKPYDLKLSFPFDSSGSEEPSNYIYRGLTTHNPKIVNTKRINEEIFPQRTVIVKFPETKTSTRYVCKFISNEYFLQPDFRIRVDTSRTYDHIRIRPVTSSQIINGRIYVLELNENLNEDGGNSYRRFGIKDLTIQSARDSITFTNADLVDISEVKSDVNVVFPPGEGGQIYVEVGNPDFNKPSEVLINNYNYTTKQISLPVLPDKDLKIKVKCVYQPALSIFGEMAEKFKYVEPGETISLVNDGIIKILSPLYDEQGVQENADFVISDNTEQGIFLHEIINVSSRKSMKMITASTALKFSDFITQEFPYENNRMYVWRFKKYFGYSSMDDFVSGIYPLDKKFSAMGNGIIFYTVK